MEHDCTGPHGRRSAAWKPVFAVVLCLSGCVAHAPRNSEPQTHVGYRSIETESTDRYAIAPDENANTPVPIENPPPEYPLAEVARRKAHVVVRTKIIVDVEGRVADVRFAEAGEGDHQPAFDAAVRAAVSHWRFVPLRIEEWKEVVDSQGNVVDAERVRNEVKPFSLDYEFSFDLRDGKPTVATNPAGSR